MSGYNTRSKVNFMAYTPFCDKLIELHVAYIIIIHGMLHQVAIGY